MRSSFVLLLCAGLAACDVEEPLATSEAELATSEWTSLAGSVTGPPVAARNANWTLEVFAVGNDGALYHRRQLAVNGEFAGWESLGGSLRGDLTPAIGRNANGRLEVLAVGNDGALWRRTQGASYTWPTGWQSLGGVVTQSPALGQNKDGRLEVFVVGTDGAIYHKWQTAPNGGYVAGWNNLGTQTGRAPAVGQNLDGRLEVFVVGTDGQVRHRWQTSPNGNWAGAWNVLGGSGNLAPAVARNADGRLEVFVVDASGRAWHRWQTTPNGDWYAQWRPMAPGTLTQVPAVVLNQHGLLEMLAVGPGGAPFRRVQTAAATGGYGAVLNDAWSDDDAIGGVVSRPLSAMFTWDGTVQVFGRGTDTAVYTVLSMSRFARPDVLMQLRHPLDGCLDDTAAEAARLTLVDKFVELHPDVEVLGKCVAGATTFGVFTDAVPAAMRPRASSARRAAIGKVDLIGNAGIGFHYNSAFLLKHARKQLFKDGHRFDQAGEPDADGEVQIDQIWDLDPIGWSGLQTELVGEIHVPGGNPDFTLEINDQLSIDPTSQLLTCTTSASMQIDNPSFYLHFIPIIGSIIYAIEFYMLGDAEGPRDMPAGGVGCALAGSVPSELDVALPAALSKLKIVLRYADFSITTAGFATRAFLQLVPRQPAVSIDGPGQFIGSTVAFGSTVKDLRAPLTYAWTSSGNPWTPSAATTKVTFPASKDHYVAVTVTDSTGLSATASKPVTRLIPGGGF